MVVKVSPSKAMLDCRGFIFSFKKWQNVFAGPPRNLTAELQAVILKRSIFERPNDKTNKMACVPSEDSDQPGHPPSLISLHCALSG